MIMNIIICYRYKWVGLFSALMLSLTLMSCIDEYPFCEPENPTGQQGGLRFAVKPDMHTRVVHNGLASRFDNGDKVGCVVAAKNADGSYTYKANTQWHYRDGVLVLDYVWGTMKVQVTEPWGWTHEVETFGKYPESQTHDLNLLCRQAETDPESGYLTLLDENMNYAFFFYYPYYDDEVLSEDLVDSGEEWSKLSSSGKNVVFHKFPGFPVVIPNDGLSYYTKPNPASWEQPYALDLYDAKSCTAYLFRNCLVGAVKDSYDAPDWSLDRNSYYGWADYPCFVNNTQQRRKQFSNSDFLWTRYVVSKHGGDVTQQKETTPVDLVFERMHAAIELQSDVALPMQSVWFESDTGIVRGRSVDLRSGALSPYEEHPDGIDWTNDPLQERGAVTTEKFWPLPMDAAYTDILTVPEDVAYKNYRIILPAQTDFNCYLHFTLNGSPYKIALHERLTRLEQNHLYIIRINKRGECSLKINDWEHGGFEMIEDIE